MVELIAKTPLDHIAPLCIGNMELREVDLGPVTSLAPYSGQETSFCKALMAEHGLTFPQANRISRHGKTHVIWSGLEQALLTGVRPAPALSRYAALCDQSDAWCAVQLQGESAAGVLARLTPIDLRPHVFETGHTARSDLMHMPASLTRLESCCFMIMVYRSMAGTLWHDLQRAMESIAARERE